MQNEDDDRPTKKTKQIEMKLIEADTQSPDSKVGIAVARWNSFITEKLMQGAVDALLGNGVKDENIFVCRCPGAYELPLTASLMLKELNLDGVIAIGVVIRGGTPHFEYVCNAVNQGITMLNLKSRKPVAFGVLTVDSTQQALERAGTEGNKGAEAALALLEMIELGRKINSSIQ